ncbi:hypothetical protein ABPG74_021354 [Tetrahymena malaccensis]
MVFKSKTDQNAALFIFLLSLLNIQSCIYALGFNNIFSDQNQFNNKSLTFEKQQIHAFKQSQCLEFDQINPKICLKCKQGYYLDNTSQNQCLQCQNGCQLCQSIDDCFDEGYDQKTQINSMTKIYKHFNFIKKRNLQVCQPGYFNSGGKCLNCNSPCFNCINLNTFCTDCINGFYLYNNSCVNPCPNNLVIQGNICQPNCNLGYYLDFTSNKCIQCPSGCVSCFNQYQCYNGCQPNYFFLDGQCIQTCPSGYFPAQGVFPQCQKCLQYCSACNNGNTCSSCTIFYQNQQITQIFLILGISGYFLDPTSQTCLSCPYNCLQCTSQDPSTCTSCITKLSPCLQSYQCQFPSGYFFDNQCNKIYCPANCSRCNVNGCLQCNDSYFIAQLNNTFVCQNCHGSCLNCTGSLSNQCTQCVSSLMFYNNQCLTQCPQGYYANSQNICQLCPNNLNCASCQNSTQCQTCKNGYYMSSNQNSQQQVCLPCDPACKLCTGPTSLNCLGCLAGQSACNNCAVGYFQDGQTCFQMSSQSICSKSTFPNYDKQICQSCPTNCLTCNQYACTSCISNSYYLNTDGTCQQCSQSIQYCQTCINQTVCSACLIGYRLDSQSGQCLPLCPPAVGYYQKPDLSCTTCPQGCLQCSQQGSTYVQCSSCQDGYYLDPNTNLCFICSSNCMLCNDANSCAKCSPNNYVMPATNNQPSYCVPSCISGYYQETDSRLCVQCNIDNCTQCTDSNSCSVCSNGYFIDVIYKTCNQCSDNCQICTSSQNCTQCNLGFILTQNGDGSISCVRSCLQNQYVSTNPSSCTDCNKSKCLFCYSDNRCMACTNNYYLSVNSLDPNNSTCQQCANQCSSCYGPNPNQCYSCNAGYYFLNNQCLTSSQCLALGGYYTDSQNNLCSSCYPLCKTCLSNLSYQCQSCIDGYYLSTNSCIPCDPSCLTCGSSSTQCLSCFSGQFLDSTTNKCIQSTQSCPSGFYKDIISNSCKSCLTPCSTCTGPSIFECTQCLNGYYYNQNSIIKCIQCSQSCSICHSQQDQVTQLLSQVCDTCSNGYYKSDPSQIQCLQCSQQQYSKNNQCSNCDSSCSACIDGLPTSCTSCPPKYYVLKQNPSNLFGKCDNCYQGCLSCLSNAQNQCQSCVSGYYFYNNQCYISCPYQLVPDTNSICQCQIAGCSKCIIDSVKQIAVCVSCSNPQYFLYNSSCLSICPATLYSNLIKMQCVSKCLPTEYLNQNLKQCTGNCSFYSYTDATNQQICTSKCPDGYFTDLINSVCTLCDKSCQTCNGPTSSSCITCSDKYYMQEGTNICNSICLNGYILSPSKTYCQICQTNCSSCIQSLVLYINQCLTVCPFGFQIQSGTNRCIATSYQSLQILNSEILTNQGVSPFIDLEIEGILINIDPARIVSIEWKLISSTDQTMQQLFTGINNFVFKYNLVLMISQKYLRGNQQHIFQLEVTLLNNIIFDQKVAVFVKKEMLGGKFTVNQVYQDATSAFNNFYSFSMGFFDTSRSYLIYRIQCERIKIVNSIYLVSYENLLLFDELTVNLMQASNGQSNVLIDDSYQSSTDKYYFPVSNLDQNFMCSLIIRGNSSSNDTVELKKQQDFAILFQNLTIPAFNQGLQQLNQQIQNVINQAEQSPSQIQFSQWTQMAYSLDHVISQIAVDQLAFQLIQNSLDMEINYQSNPPTIQQANKIWMSFFQNCILSSDQFNSIYCKCQGQYVGIYCQYNSTDTQVQLLTRVSNLLQNYVIQGIQQQAALNSNNISMNFVPLIRKLLSYNLNLKNQNLFFTSIIQYLTSVLQTKNQSQILDFVQDIFIIMEDLQLYVMVSSFDSITTRATLIDQLEKLKDLWGIYFSNNSYLGQSLTLMGNFCKINLVTLQQTRINDKRIGQQNKYQTYLTVSYDSININIPPEVVLDWNKITIIQRVNPFLPQFKSDTYSILLSPIYDFDLYSDESQQKITYSSMQQPFQIQLTLQAPLIMDETTKITSSLFECVYFDESTNQWSANGINLIQIINNNVIVCQTYHLSRFAIRKANLTPNYSSKAIDIKSLSQILPPTEVQIATYVPTQPGQKSLTFQDWLKQDLIQSLNLQNANKNPYYIDSFVEVQNQKITILNHLQFQGIVPFKYPGNFQTPFGLYFVLIWLLALLTLVLLIKFQVTQIIQNMVQFIIQRIKKDEAQKKEKQESEQKKKEKQNKLEDKHDKNSNQNDIELGMNTIGKTEEDENNRDLALLNKIKKDMNLLYESNNLDTPNNRQQNENKTKNEDFVQLFDKYKLKKKQIENDDEGFGSFADKKMNQLNQDENQQLSVFGYKKNPQLQEVQKSIQRRGSVLSLYSNRSPKQNTNKHSQGIQDSVIQKNASAAAEIWSEQDFMMKQNIINFQKNTKNQDKDQSNENQVIFVKNPLNYFKWYNHHPLINIFVKEYKIQSSKLLIIIQFSLVILSLGTCSTITNDLDNLEAYFITILVAPALTQFFFSLYNFFFFQASQSIKYSSLRGGSLYFTQAFNSRYLIGLLVISVLIFLGDSILLILFGQKRYIQDYSPVLIRFGISVIFDIFVVEILFLIIAYVIFRLKKKISPFRYYLYFIMKGYALNFAEISDFYLKKSEKDQKEQKKIRNIVFNGDIQKKKREKQSKKKAEKKNKSKEGGKQKKEHAKSEKKKINLEQSENL